MNRYLAVILTLAFLSGSCCLFATEAESLFSIKWGTQKDRIGLRPPGRGALPMTPFMGPGGFRIDESGSLWISDSIQQKIKKFSANGAVRTFQVRGKGLGDLEITAEHIFVVRRSPHGIACLERATGKEVAFTSIPLHSPGRLRVVASQSFLLEDKGSQVWTVVQGKVVKHPAGAMEPVWNGKYMFGTQYEFQEDSRKILYGLLDIRPAEPEQFALFRSLGRRIVFSRLAGIVQGWPVLQVTFADSPDVYEIYHFASDGSFQKMGSLPVFRGCGMASEWLLTTTGVWYGLEASETGFTIHKRQF